MDAANKRVGSSIERLRSADPYLGYNPKAIKEPLLALNEVINGYNELVINYAENYSLTVEELEQKIEKQTEQLRGLEKQLLELNSTTKPTEHFQQKASLEGLINKLKNSLSKDSFALELMSQKLLSVDLILKNHDLLKFNMKETIDNLFKLIDSRKKIIEAYDNLKTETKTKITETHLESLRKNIHLARSETKKPLPVVAAQELLSKTKQMALDPKTCRQIIKN